MKRHRTRVLAATAAIATNSALVLAAALIVVPALATPQSGVTSTQVAMGRFGEINVKTHNFPPHKVKIKLGKTLTSMSSGTPSPRAVTTGWHTHPGPSLITVTSGEITAYEGDDPTCRPKVYRSGEGFVDPGDGTYICCATRPAHPRRRLLSRSFRRTRREGSTPPTPATARSEPLPARHTTDHGP